MQAAWAEAVPQHTGARVAGGKVPAAPLETEKEQLRAAQLESPAAEQCGDAPQAGSGKHLPGFLLQRCHRQLQTNTWSNGCNGFWARVPQNPQGSSRMQGGETGTR